MSHRAGRPGTSARGNLRANPLSRRGVLLGGVGACLLAAGVGAARPGGWSRHDAPARGQGVDPQAVTAVPTDEPIVAVTFDDGPDPAYTPAVLDILGEFGVPATFFMIGRLADQHPDLVRRVHREGHVVANHTADHLWLDRLRGEAVHDQIERGEQILAAHGGVAPAFFRPPRGLTSPIVATVTQSLGARSYFWGTCLEANLTHHDTEGAAILTADRCHPGAIVLAHDGGHLDGPNPQAIDRSRTVEALPLLLRRIRAQGLGFATLPRLVATARD